MTFTFTPAKFKNKRLQSCEYLIQTEVDYSEGFLLGKVLISSKRMKERRSGFWWEQIILGKGQILPTKIAHGLAVAGGEHVSMYQDVFSTQKRLSPFHSFIIRKSINIIFQNKTVTFKQSVFPLVFYFVPFRHPREVPLYIWLHIETWLPHLQHQFFRLLQHSLFMQQPTTHGHGRGGGKVQTLQPKNHSRCGMSTVKMATFWHKKNGGKFTSFRRHFPGATPNNPWVNFTYQIIRPFLKSVSLTHFFTKLHN